MYKKFYSNRFVVSQLDNVWACSSLLIKKMGPEYGEVVEGKCTTIDLSDPDDFFKMFDNLFQTKHPNGVGIRDGYGNPSDYFGVAILTYRPHQYGFFIFYCAHQQIPTTGKLLESLGCSVQKTRATKTSNNVALYVIESGKFLDQYEEWMRKMKDEGNEVFGTPRKL